MLTPPASDTPMKLDAVWTTGAGANGAMLDTDRDGLPDGWETFYGFNPRNSDDAAMDADGDGASGLAEFQAGTDPHNVESALRLGLLRRTRGGIEISFNSVYGKFYRLERSATLGSESWTAVGEPMVGTGGMLKLLDNAPAGDNGFYRIQVLSARAQ